MKRFITIILWSCLMVQRAFSEHIEDEFEKGVESVPSEVMRDRRDVIEEEKYYNIRTDRKEIDQPSPWLPHPLPPEDPTTKVSLTNHNNEVKNIASLYQTTEIVTDKPTGRGARASNENWVKLPFPTRDEVERDNVLTPPQPSGELINSRMPRVNFVTQNKQLETSESRNDKQAIQRPRFDKTEELRTEFVRPNEDDRSKQFKPVYPRQALYYPEESRRYYEDKFYPTDELYKRDPYNDLYDRRRYYPTGPRVDRFDDGYDYYVPRKPKRIIYYAHLPEVVRTPPSVDLRYRYTVDPYGRYDDDYSTRNGRYDNRFRNRYPYAPLKKDERNYRDLAGAGTSNKENKVDDKVTPTPVLSEKENKQKDNSNGNRNVPVSRNLVNSHQYHDAVNDYNDRLSHKAFRDLVQSEDDYLRFDEPLFHGAVEDPYQRKY